MSSTHRGKERNPFDYYPTPDWCADAAIKAFGSEWTLDPCAGDGQLIRAVLRANPTQYIEGIEIQDHLREHCGMVFAGDGLTRSWHGQSVICNPPFANAIDWMSKAVAECDKALFLVRLAMLSGKARRKFWDKHPPKVIGILSQRPSFTGGQTDSADYMWVGWRRGNTEPTRMVWL